MGSKGLLTIDEIREEQLRVALSIATMAAAYYVQLFGFKGYPLWDWTTWAIRALTPFWALYLLFASLAMAYDRLESLVPGKLFRWSLDVAHACFGFGVLVLILIAFLLCLGFVEDIRTTLNIPDWAILIGTVILILGYAYRIRIAEEIKKHRSTRSAQVPPTTGANNKEQEGASK